jgi:hypothetical protein
MQQPSDPWADHPIDVTPQDAGNPFRRGVAPVSRRPQPTVPQPTASQPTVSQPGPPQAPHHPTGTGWPGAYPPRSTRSEEFRQLRIGAGYTITGAIFAFVCWGLWAISSRGDLRSPIAIFILTLLVAAGLYVLARIVGRVVLEKQLNRVRRSARGAHLVTGLFLTAVGIVYLRQIDWIMSAVRWAGGLF